MDKTSTNEKALMDLKEFMNYTGFKETYARQLIRQPRTGFAIKLGKSWYVHKGRFDIWLNKKIEEF